MQRMRAEMEVVVAGVRRGWLVTILALAAPTKESRSRHTVSFRHCLYSDCGGHGVPPKAYVR